MMTLQETIEMIKRKYYHEEKSDLLPGYFGKQSPGEWQKKMRGLLEEYPAGIVEKEDGSIVPVESSRDGRSFLLGLKLKPGEQFRILFLDRSGSLPPVSWNLHSPGGNVELLREEQFQEGDGRRSTLRVFTFKVLDILFPKRRIQNPNVFRWLKHPVIFKRVIPPIYDGYRGAVATLGTTRLYVSLG